MVESQTAKRRKDKEWRGRRRGSGRKLHEHVCVCKY